MAPAGSPPHKFKRRMKKEETPPSPTKEADRRRLPNNSPIFSVRHPPMAASPSKCGASSATASPVRFFLFFHDAVRSELGGLHRAAVAYAADPRADVRPLLRRCRFLWRVYRHHSDAEDEVIFPALDMHVKNVVTSYSLEHKGESVLFDQLFALLTLDRLNDASTRREVASCTGAIQTLLNQHMSKEENQVFPLLVDKLSFKEQASLVWELLCSIPVNVMSEFLPWLLSSIPSDQQPVMLECLCEIVPKGKLIRQVVFTWLEGINTKKLEVANHDHLKSDYCMTTPPSRLLEGCEQSACAVETPCRRKRKYPDVTCDPHADSVGKNPIDILIFWHRAIRQELKDMIEDTRKLRHVDDFPKLLAVKKRLRFIAEMCSFHSKAAYDIIFPAVDLHLSFAWNHNQEECELNNFKCLIECIHNLGNQSSVPELYLELHTLAKSLKDRMEKHFYDEEVQVLPLAREHLSFQKQRELVYQSLCVMPLKVVECVLSWLAEDLGEEEAQFFIQNMQLAAPLSDTALVTLLTGWACRDHLQVISGKGKFKCSSLNIANGVCLQKAINKNAEYSSCQKCTYNESVVFVDSGGRAATGSFYDGTNCFDKSIRTADDLPQTCSDHTCCVPGLGVDSNIEKNPKSLRCLPNKWPSVPSFSSSLFLWEAGAGTKKSDTISKPIDTIFKFHKVILKDLEFLDIECGKIVGYNKSSFQQYIGRFQLLWSLYKAHSNAEDGIVFPALESKEGLHNVSQAYILDHKLEEKLFEDISSMISLICRNREVLGSDACTFQHAEDDLVRQYNEMVMKLQGMCRSLHVTLDQHIMREELELWPLFDKLFSVEEQDKIVGRIIGSTGAEVLQSMLPWVSSALSHEEQSSLMDAWKQATRNTLFNEWLNEWWEGAAGASEQCLNAYVATHEGTDIRERLDSNTAMFKSGWKDIFRLNQAELEMEIRKLSQDPTINSQKKDYLMQNLMTSRWIAAQQKLPLDQIMRETGEEIPGCSPSFRDAEKQIFGCEHYKKNCKILSACCNKLFTCRFCHDNASDHSIDRKATAQMMCMRCLKIQPIGPICRTPSCEGFKMAKYYCSICKFFDDERVVYHCPFCNLCRVGKGLGVDFFHCMQCNCCLNFRLEQHVCREKGLEINCPICCDYLFTSIASVKALPCGHYMCSSCFQAYTCSHYVCPICSKTMGDMSVYFSMLDALLAVEELPEEYGNRYQDILCHDCDKKGVARFHWLYHKCRFCSSYNTRVIKSENVNSHSST